MFDLDGTLVIRWPDLANATNTALHALGCPTHPLAAYRYFVGDGARNLCVRALPADRPELVDEAVRLMRAHYEAHWSDLTRPYPGIPELVGELGRRGLKLAVLSNKPDPFTKQLVTHYFRGQPFAAVRGQRPDRPLKPDPTTGAGNGGGVRGGAGAVAVPRGHQHRHADRARGGDAGGGGALGFRPRAELEASGAEEIIAAPGELLDCWV